MRHLLAVAALALSPLAQAESYSLLIYETPAVLAERDQPAKASAYWQAYDHYAGALMQAGVLRGGTALEPGSEVAAATLSGYFVLDVPTRAEAERWAAQAPARVSRVEVRAHRANPHMAARQ